MSMPTLASLSEALICGLKTKRLLIDAPKQPSHANRASLSLFWGCGVVCVFWGLYHCVYEYTYVSCVTIQRLNVIVFLPACSQCDVALFLCCGGWGAVLAVRVQLLF